MKSCLFYVITYLVFLVCLYVCGLAFAESLASWIMTREFILSLAGVCATTAYAFSIAPLASTSFSVAFCALMYGVVNKDTFSLTM